MGPLTRGEMVRFRAQATALHNLYLFVGQMHKCAGCEAAAVIAEVCWGSRKEAGCNAGGCRHCKGKQ